MTSEPFINTAIKVDTRPQVENRLIFEFPSTEGGPLISRVCPFFENPMISESQAANLVTYDVLGRAGNFFGYTGAKSRAYNLEFFLTLPNIIHTAAAELYSQPPSPLSRNQKKEAFFQAEETNQSNAPTLTYEKKRKELLAMVNDGIPEPAPGVLNAANLFPDIGPNASIVPTEGDTFMNTTTSEYMLAKSLGGYYKGHVYSQGVQMVLFWVKLIRASVLNNQQHPTFGPPIIRIKLGELYDYISCLATKYSISWDDTAGYDVVTYLPNRIKINLSLVQVQRNPGTNRTYNPKNIQESKRRGNEVLSGWEDFEDNTSWADWLNREAPSFVGAL